MIRTQLDQVIIIQDFTKMFRILNMQKLSSALCKFYFVVIDLSSVDPSVSSVISNL